MVTRLTVLILAIVIALISTTIITGCEESNEGDPVINNITFDPGGTVPPNTDVHVVADVVGENLEYRWTVTGGLMREMTTHLGQLDASDPAIAVTLPALDDVGDVLGGLGFEYDTYSLDTLGTAIASGCDAIFINSSDAISVTAADVIIKTWVEDGGALYASGRAADYVDTFWPNKITFPEPDPYVGSANTTGDFIYGKVMDSSAAMNLGFNDFIIDYPHYNWPPMISIASAVKLIARADASDVIDIGAIGNLPDGEDFSHMPTSVSFSAGDGFVLFTNHHLTSDMDIEERELMDFLVTQVVAFPLVKVTHELINLAGYYPDIDYSGLIEENQQDVYTFDLTDVTDIYMVLNAPDGKFKLEVDGPGDIENDITGNVPISMAFPNIEDGTWEIRVTATDTEGLDRLPYVLSIGQKVINEQLITTVPEIIWRTPLEPGTYGVTLRVLDEQFHGDQFTAGIKVE